MNIYTVVSGTLMEEFLSEVEKRSDYTWRSGDKLTEWNPAEGFKYDPFVLFFRDDGKVAQGGYELFAAYGDEGFTYVDPEDLLKTLSKEKKSEGGVKPDVEAFRELKKILKELLEEMEEK